jgi:hypothetical protein
MIKKNLDLIIVALIMVAIIMYEWTIETLEEILHLIFEVLHHLFEWIELGVEKVVEHVFQYLDISETVEYLFTTERHGEQVVTFYILMSFIAYGLYRLGKLGPRCYFFLKEMVLISWIRRKTQCQLYWESLNQLHKLSLLATAVCVTLLASFLII